MVAQVQAARLVILRLTLELSARMHVYAIQDILIIMSQYVQVPHTFSYQPDCDYSCYTCSAAANTNCLTCDSSTDFRTF